MAKNLQQVLEIVDANVKEFMERNKSSLPPDIKSSEEKMNHVFEIATSIMRTKWGVGYPGGSFVHAVVENNLSRALTNADIICREALFFFVLMVLNIDMPMDVYWYKKKLEEVGV